MNENLDPLFHGTSTIFIPSIIRHGLGGISPVVDFRAIELLKHLADSAASLLCDDEWWQCEAAIIQQMTQQRITNSGMNFRHGDVYLAASEQKAVGYACSNKFGSEMISTCLELFDRLAPFAPNLKVYCETNFSELLSLRAQQPQPALIKLRDVPVKILRSETGGSINDTLQLMKKMKEFGDVGLQMANFTLISALPANSLEFFIIQTNSRSSVIGDYSLSTLPNGVA